MKSILTSTAIFLSLSMLGGCATLTRGDTQYFKVVSTPPGAEVLATDGSGCAPTPCTMIARRGDTFIATIEKHGYVPYEVEVKSHLSAAGTAGFMGNVFFGGLIGMIWDVRTKSTQNLSPNPLQVTLEPTKTASIAP